MMERMPTVIKGLWALAATGALCAIYLIIAHVLRADNAEHQMQCSIVALAVTIVPYCLASATTEATRKQT